jgi:hypothetical protein
MMGFDHGMNQWRDVQPGTNGTQNSDFRIWNRPVYALADGVVTFYQNDQDENPQPGVQLGGVGWGNALLMRGPKVQGGALGIVALTGQGTVRSADLADSVIKITRAGYKSSIHTDDHHPTGIDGCGFAKKWSERQLQTLRSRLLEMPLPTAKVEMEQAGAKPITLTGNHDEESLRLNLVRDMTFEPDGTDFNLDAWFTLGIIDAQVLMLNTLDTISTIRPDLINWDDRVEVFV